MRIFRHGAGNSGPEKAGFGIESVRLPGSLHRHGFGYVLEDQMKTRKIGAGNEPADSPSGLQQEIDWEHSSCGSFGAAALFECTRQQFPMEIASLRQMEPGHSAAG